MEANEADGSDDEQPDRNERQARDERPVRSERFSRDSRPRRDQREERSARDEPEPQHVNGETIPFDALPPAIGRDESEAATEEKPRTPRRRSRTPRPAEGEDEVAPAA
jgi:ribonuclease E